ncbi:MAG: CsgE family curli-type amyloid fiber assembly protein [Bacteroidota bacterium]
MLQTWIDQRLEGSTATFSAYVLNRDTATLELTYEMISEREGPSGTASNTQRNVVLAVPQVPKVLSVIQMDLKTEDRFQIVLRVFKGQQLLALDTLSNGRPSTQLSNTSSVQKAKPPPTSGPTQSSDELEIDGLIIDETRTKIGRDFYDMFYRGWIPPANVKDYIVVVKELPSRGRVARVSIFVNEEEVSRRVIQARADMIETQVGYAIRHINRHFANKVSVRKELEDEDQQGSGIF